MEQGGQGRVTPERVVQIVSGSWAARALESALELRLFTLVAEGKATLPALLEATGASRRGLPMLLDAMVGFGLLTREGSGEAARYGLAADADAFLVEGRPAYFGDLWILLAEEYPQTWARLTDSVRSGEPAKAFDRPEEGVPFWKRLVPALFPLNRAPAGALGAELRRLHPEGELRVLDVASGSGVWGIGAAQGEARVRVTAMDLPETLEITRQFVQREGLEGQYDFLPGNLRETEFGEGRFHAAILGHICHSEGVEESRRLFRKVHRALLPGGTIAIPDRFPDPERKENVPALLFTLNMLLHTTEGSCWTIPEYTAWLEEAGFGDVRPLAVPGPEPILVAEKRGDRV